MNVKAGDIVHVRARVLRRQVGCAPVVQIPDGATFSVPFAEIVHVESRPLQVGDRVTWGVGATTYRIAAIVGAKVWLDEPQWRDGGHRCPGTDLIRPLADLVRA